MPLSHLTLTVSHLPTSTSFFLSCLQPLGYKFIGRHDEFIGFGSKADEPADFWLAQEKPGTPAGAAHIAFPAPSEEAVNAFFISALKAGGKIHGEPKIRDPQSGYFSAAVVDLDGNSIEAAYRPSNSNSSSTSRSDVRGPSALQTIKNGSVVSRARSVKTETVMSMSHERSVHAIENIPPSRVQMLYNQQPQPQQSSADTYQSYPAAQPQGAADNAGSNLTAKTIIGTLLGATAGAAIAYAMIKGDSSSSSASPASSPASSQSSAPSPIAAPPQPQFIQQQSLPQQMAMSLPMIMPMLGPAPGAAPTYQEQPTYRALEAPPSQARSAFTANDAISAYTRSTTSKSKSPRADTIYEETEYYPPIEGPSGGGASIVYSQEPSTSGVRRSANGSVYATRDLPIRAIEYTNGMMSTTSSSAPSSQKIRSKSYPCDPSTFISSYAETQQKQGHIIEELAESEFSSISTIKPAKSSTSHRSSSSKSDKYYHSNQSNASHHSAASHRSSKSSSKHSSHSHHSSHQYPEIEEPAATVYSSTSSSRTAHKLALPDSRAGSTYSIPHSSASRSSKRSSKEKDRYRDMDSYSAHEIPLPESAAPSTVFLDAVDVDTHITPDDSISQVGVNTRNENNRSSSGRSHRSKSGPSSNVSASRERDREGSSASKFDQPVRPSDSISQVSSNRDRHHHHETSSRVSERTVKAGSKVHSKSGSRASGHY